MDGLHELSVPHINTRDSFPSELLFTCSDVRVETDLLLLLRRYHACFANTTRFMATLKDRLVYFGFRCGFTRNQDEFPTAAAQYTVLRSMTIRNIRNNKSIAEHATIASARLINIRVPSRK